jgi:hypothetical protein
VQLPATFGVREHPECFIVCDANGQALAYVYFEEELDRRSATNLLPATRPGFRPSALANGRPRWGVFGAEGLRVPAPRP